MDRTVSAFRTEVSFELPLGYVDDAGVRHRRGVMRFATAADEILPMRDPRVQANPHYLSIIILARVIRLEGVASVDTQIVESLYTKDFEYLRRLYEEVNGGEEPELDPALPARKPNGRGAAGGPPVLGEA